MRLVLLVLFTALCSSCSVPADGGQYDLLPQGVILDITAKNDMDTPITIKIRHTYSWDWGTETLATYTDWTTERLAGGTSQRIGVETVKQSNTHSTWEVSGFVLLDGKLGNIKGPTLISSFDLEIETADAPLHVSGNDVTGVHYQEEIRLCTLQIFRKYNQICRLYTYKQRILLQGAFTSFVLPVCITIRSDGNFSFEHEDAQDGKGVSVSPY